MDVISILQKKQQKVASFDVQYRDNGGAQQHSTVSAPEFLRRVLQHVLPRGFQRVRHYVWLGAAAQAPRRAAACHPPGIKNRRREVSERRCTPCTGRAVPAQALPHRRSPMGGAAMDARRDGAVQIIHHAPHATRKAGRCQHITSPDCFFCLFGRRRV